MKHKKKDGTGQKKSILLYFIVTQLSSTTHRTVETTETHVLYHIMNETSSALMSSQD